MAHVLLVPVGSHGDVHPFVAIGQGLRARGHRVSMITSEPFRSVAERNGLEFVQTLTTDEYNAMMQNPDLWNPKKGLKVILNHELLRRHIPLVFEAIRARYKPGETVAVGGTLAFAARVANDALGVPYTTVHLQPMSCCSVSDPPVASNGVNMTWLPRPLIRLAYWGAEKWITDPLMAPAINEFRASLHLPPIRRVLTKWSPSPERVIGLFPDWFGPIPDGGPAFRHAGFVLFDDAAGRPTPEHLRTFMANGPPPAIFSFGSAMLHGRDYFDAAVEACRILNIRGVLLGADGEQIPDKLPPGVVHASYAPFSDVFPRAACVVHHGGLGTSAQALRAGVPQLVMPLAYDQADNAVRMRRLGIAALLYPKRFTGNAVAERLKRLIDNDEVKQAAQAVSERFRGADGTATACRLIEELVVRDAAPASSAVCMTLSARP
jgi:UDP:flavonoid glycosyltransferase YjiC (YdhE family)